jgi:ubiquinone/menaquinone biosynthesis C-methylase UbiE
LHNLYGPGTRQVLKSAGLQRGMRVADLGCGVGLVTRLLAQLVGPQGLAVGIDFSDEQLAVARRQTSAARNTCFVRASATDTDLPGETFDLIYCRFLLIHLP